MVVREAINTRKDMGRHRSGGGQGRETILRSRGNVLDAICCGLRGESGSQGEGGLAGGKSRRGRRGGRCELEHMMDIVTISF